jgi:hypothetical protein
MPDEQEDNGGLSARVGEAAFVQRLFDELPFKVFALEGPELRVAAATAEFRAFTGRQNMIGVPVQEAFPEIAGQQLIDIPKRVYATGQPASLRDFRAQMELPDTGERVEFFSDFNVRPRRNADGEVTGVVVDIADTTERVRERQAARRLADEARQRYEQARDVIDVLQRELLPIGVPVLPRVQIAASYLLADSETTAGGDWFDAVPLPDGRVALVVGDVVGHGVAASATMGQLRTVLHERLAATADIVTALRAVNTAAAVLHRGASAAAGADRRWRRPLPALHGCRPARRGRRLHRPVRRYRAARPRRDGAAVHRRHPGAAGPGPGGEHGGTGAGGR